ncbi:MAG: hypothetical protein WD273_11855 [Trueperaceae bacterium]
MQPRAEEIYRVLSSFVQAKRAGEADGSRRRSFALVVQGSTPMQAQVRELRGGCVMIDIGSSIFTLAYCDILGIDPASSDEGGLRVTVRPGCFASHVAARLRRAAPRPWSASTQNRPLAQPDDGPVHDLELDAYLSRSAGEENGGIAESDPAESARHEIVGNNASRRSR